VQKQDEVFVVQSSKQQYRTRLVLLAMGKQGVPRKLGVPGEESSKVLYRLIEAEGYSDDDILVVGGGDSALEAAVALSKINDNRVTISYRGDSFKRARERNREKLDTQRATGRVKVMFTSEVASIESEAVRLRHSGDELELPNNFVFAMIGGESPEEFLRRSGVEIVEKVVSGH
jgi:thioredoxin reductase (NADPH)